MIINQDDAAGFLDGMVEAIFVRADSDLFWHCFEELLHIYDLDMPSEEPLIFNETPIGGDFE